MGAGVMQGTRQIEIDQATFDAFEQALPDGMDTREHLARLMRFYLVQDRPARLMLTGLATVNEAVRLGARLHDVDVVSNAGPKCEAIDDGGPVVGRIGRYG